MRRAAREEWRPRVVHALWVATLGLCLAECEAGTEDSKQATHDPAALGKTSMRAQAGERAHFAESKGASAGTAGPGARSAEHREPEGEASDSVLVREATCLGTRCTLMVSGADETTAGRGFRAALTEIQRLDRLMTSWLETSDVSRINQAAGNGEWIAVSPETFEVLKRSQWIAELSRGAFDITVGAFRGLWKFDQDNDGSLPEIAEVKKRLQLVDYRDLLLEEATSSARLRRSGMRITLGGIAKGFIVDRAVEALRKQGLENFVIQAGGDLFAVGTRSGRPWRVGIQDPRASIEQERSSDTSFALVELSDSAFNTSGDYERFIIKEGERYHHILDPTTGLPVRHTRSVTVLAPTSFLADTVDTAVFVLGRERGMALVEAQPGLEAVLVDDQGKVHVSSGLKQRLKLLRPPRR